jgi:hypothetical protein
MLCVGKLARFFEHVPALNMDRRIVWLNPQGFLIQHSGFAIIPGIAGAIGPRNHVARNSTGRLTPMKKTSPLPRSTQRPGEPTACASNRRPAEAPAARSVYDSGEQYSISWLRSKTTKRSMPPSFSDSFKLVMTNPRPRFKRALTWVVVIAVQGVLVAMVVDLGSRVFLWLLG